MSGFQVIKPGVLSLIQDGGRFGFYNLGLTNGGALDMDALRWGNRLCGNPMDAAGIEISIGGLVLRCELSTRIAITGAELSLTINGRQQSLWRTHRVDPGDIIELGFASRGLRAYLCVAGGIQVEPVFGSVATVTRESLGGLAGNGKNLCKGDLLACNPDPGNELCRVPDQARPIYANHSSLRVIPGYQQHLFSKEQQNRFFTGHYRITDKSDRMGYQLKGPGIKSSHSKLLSEGICLGAIQIPPDGHPIILLHDRPTIGGYPKLGSLLSLDTARLTQLPVGTPVRFEKISIDDAQNLVREAELKFRHTAMEHLGTG